MDDKILKINLFHRLFDGFVSIVFCLILVLIIVGVGIGAIQLVMDLWTLLRFEGVTGKYINLITDVLTLYVLVELSRSLIEYFDTKKLRLTFIIDAAIVFLIREVLIGVFKHQLDSQMLYALAVMLLVLGLLRLGSGWLYLQEKRIRRLDKS